jgi:DNA-binding NtrC family response regulator
MVGESPGMLAVREMVARVGPTHATVLITGETGTGKELVARALQASSPRADRPFIEVNCAAFTESLLDSQLFGHERGAFTGADRSRQGLFEAANLGTLFLDEAGEMSLPLQAKLLRVLVNGVVVRVGSTATRKVDVRILVATHRDLLERVSQGLFREDLYYRLAVVPIRVPPLRERRQDIPALARHLLAQVASDLKMEVKTFSPDALAKLSAYSFPGNVRELRNLVERATILTRSEEIRAVDLPDLGGEGNDAGSGTGSLEQWLASLGERPDLRETLVDVERRLVQRALSAASGVQAEAARRLGLSRSDLSYKIKKLGLSATAEDGED